MYTLDSMSNGSKPAPHHHVEHHYTPAAAPADQEPEPTYNNNPRRHARRECTPSMIVQLAALLLGWQPVAVPLSHRRAAVTACAPQPAEAAEAGNWFVAVPRSLDAIAEQAGRSVLGAIRSGQRRVWVEVAAPEFDPSSPLFRQLRLSTLVMQMALPLLGRRDVLPASRPQVKVLYNTVDEATIASGSSFVADLPVSVLSSSLAIGPADGAFVVVAPSKQGAAAAAPTESAMAGLVAAAGDRPVIVVNPRLGNSAALSGFEPGYLLRPLSVTYRKDAYAEPTQGSGCLLRCYPHEWSVLVQPPAGDWFYAGRFDAQPSPQQLEAMLVDGFTRARFA